MDSEADERRYGKMDAQRKRPTLEAWTKEYVQDADTCSTEEVQRLDIEQVDGGGGPYWRIKTEEWAISSIAELIETLKSAGVSETDPN